MHRVGPKRLLIASTLLLQLAGSVARAGEPTAQELKERANQAMGELRYGDALELYMRAYELEPDPALYYNRARAYEALGRFPEALDQILAFEREASPDLKAKVPLLGDLVKNLRSRVSTLRIDCEVTGARIVLGGVEVAKAPVKEPLRVNAGEAVLDIFADGYEPYRQKLELRGNEVVLLTPKLTLKGTTGVLAVSSNVAGSTVFVDGRRLGDVPVQIDVVKGRHAVRVTHDGFKEGQTTTLVLAGQRTNLHIELESEPTVLERWWFWTIAAGVVATGTAVTVALLTERSADKGDIPPGQIAAPLAIGW